MCTIACARVCRGTISSLKSNAPKGLVAGIKELVVTGLAALVVLFPTEILPQTNTEIALVVKSAGTFMLIRGDKVWRNTIPNETLYQNDRIVTLDDGFVAFILRDTKEMMAVRPFSEMVIVGGKQTGINFHEIIPILKLKVARNPYEQISTSVAGVKG